MKNFTGIMKAQMERLGIKHEVLAKELNIARTTVTAYCNGNRQPDIETMAKICQILHIDLSWVLDIPDLEENELILKDEFEVKVNEISRKVPKEYHQKFLEGVNYLVDVFCAAHTNSIKKDE